MAIVMTTSSGDWRNNASRPEREPDARCETTCLMRSMDISVTESIVRRELASEAAGKDVDGTLAEGLYKHTGAREARGPKSEPSWNETWSGDGQEVRHSTSDLGGSYQRAALPCKYSARDSLGHYVVNKYSMY